MVSSPSLAKASPAEEKISPTLFELLMLGLQSGTCEVLNMWISRAIGWKKL